MWCDHVYYEPAMCRPHETRTLTYQRRARFARSRRSETREGLRAPVAAQRRCVSHAAHTFTNVIISVLLSSVRARHISCRSETLSQ